MKEIYRSPARVMIIYIVEDDQIFCHKCDRQLAPGAYFRSFSLDHVEKGSCLSCDMKWLKSISEDERRMFMYTYAQENEQRHAIKIYRRHQKLMKVNGEI
jgi:hypothetical protein